MKKKILILAALFLIAAVIFIASWIFLIRFNTASPSASSFSNLNQIKNDELLNSEIEKEKLPQKQEEVSLIAVGDIMLSRDVARKMKTKGLDYPFLKTRDVLKSGDLVFGNLETPITSGREINTNELVFRADPGVEKELKEAGFTILSLANNHTPNFGEKGLEDTFQYLNQAGIKYVGAGENETEANNPVFLTIKGLKFSFLAYNDNDVVPKNYQAGQNHAGTAFMDIEKIAQAVKEAKQQSDFVIVSMHSGKEYTNKPDQSQINFAHDAIDAGAELVVGHHPHVVQTVEKYNGKYIFYSLGNFIFDQMWSKETKEGLMLKIFFDKKGVKKITPLPILIEDFSQPRILDGLQATVY